MEHGNAVQQARTPNYSLWTNAVKRSLLDASGPAVGLDPDEMGNSEVVTSTWGVGFIVFQDITRIDNAIRDGTFAQIRRC